MILPYPLGKARNQWPPSGTETEYVGIGFLNGFDVGVYGYKKTHGCRWGLGCRRGI